MSDAIDKNDMMRLVEAEEIKQLKARYCRLIDTKQWSRLHGLFTEDARFEGLGSAPSGCDRKTFVEGVSGRLQDCISVHHCHQPEIVVGADTLARGIWAMSDYLEWPVGISPREAPGQRGFVGFGFYEEEYRKNAGEWRIAFLRLTRLRVDALPLERLPSTQLIGATSLGPAASAADWLSS